MSDYYGNAKLEDWLKEEVFGYDIEEEKLKLFEEFREGIESNIESWLDSDDGYGNNLSWRGWGRGFNGIQNMEKFENIVKNIK